MKAIIFAGGTGTRLWPLSREKSPKQFEKLIGDKSTLQLSVERLIPDFKFEDIYISSNFIYKDIIRKQLPEIPEKNLILEPEKKDVAPAIALAVGIVSLNNPYEPIIILWSDHFIKKTDLFKKIIKTAVKKIEKNYNQIIFIGNKPRFPSVNLGYIHVGRKIEEVNGVSFYRFNNLVYRPSQRKVKKYFYSEEYAWNLGYFVTSPYFINESFKNLSPNIYNNIQKILKSYKKENFLETLKKYYKKVESINFDNAILEKLDKQKTSVIIEDIGWSDVGSWEALKESIQKYNHENIFRGKVYLEHAKDSLVYNYEENKLIVGIDLDQNIIINTKDVILISKKSSMSKLKKIVEKFNKNENKIHT